jgi:hypothetical protein
MKNQKLITALSVVVKSLENNTIEYDWTQPSKCNCGLVAQAITGVGHKALFERYIHPLIEEMMSRDAKFKEGHPSWQNMVGEYCPMTGMPTAEIFKVLFKAGLTRDAIGHLEYLSDLRIVAKAKISTESVTEDTIIKEKQEIVTREGFWGIGRKVEFRTVNNTRKIKKRYFESKSNLIKYLKAWIELIEESHTEKPFMNFGKPISQVTTAELSEAMKAALLVQKFEDASILRDELNRREKVPKH